MPMLGAVIHPLGWGGIPGQPRGPHSKRRRTERTGDSTGRTEGGSESSRGHTKAEGGGEGGADADADADVARVGERGERERKSVNDSFFLGSPTSSPDSTGARSKATDSGEEHKEGGDEGAHGTGASAGAGAGGVAKGTGGSGALQQGGARGPMLGALVHPLGWGGIPGAPAMAGECLTRVEAVLGAYFAARVGVIGGDAPRGGKGVGFAAGNEEHDKAVHVGKRGDVVFVGSLKVAVAVTVVPETESTVRICIRPVIGDVFLIHAIYKDIREAIIMGDVGMPASVTLARG